MNSIFAFIIQTTVSLSDPNDLPPNCVGTFEMEVVNVQKADDYVKSRNVCLTTGPNPDDPLNTWSGFQIVTLTDLQGRARKLGIGGQIDPPTKERKDWIYSLRISDWDRTVNDPAGLFTHAAQLASSELRSDALRITPQLSIGDSDDAEPIVKVRLVISHLKKSN